MVEATGASRAALEGIPVEEAAVDIRPPATRVGTRVRTGATCLSAPPALPTATPALPAAAPAPAPALPAAVPAPALPAAAPALPAAASERPAPLCACPLPLELPHRHASPLKIRANPRTLLEPERAPKAPGCSQDLTSGA